MFICIIFCLNFNHFSCILAYKVASFYLSFSNQECKQRIKTLVPLNALQGGVNMCKRFSPSRFHVYDSKSHRQISGYNNFDLLSINS